MKLHTKLGNQNQATRLTIGGKKGWKIPMARFYAGVFEGNPIQATPTGWRKKIPGYRKWSPPYLGGTQVSYDLELTDTNTSVRLFNLKFYVINTASKNKNRIEFDSSKQEKKSTIDTYTVTNDGMQVWVGEPESKDSVLLVQADAWNPTNTIVGLLGIIGGVIIKWLLDFLASLF